MCDICSLLVEKTGGDPQKNCMGCDVLAIVKRTRGNPENAGKLPMRVVYLTDYTKDGYDVFWFPLNISKGEVLQAICDRRNSLPRDMNCYYSQLNYETTYIRKGDAEILNISYPCYKWMKSEMIARINTDMR